MGFAEAAELHKKWTAMAPSDVQIGSISPSRGGGGYFKQWYDACGGDACRMDFIAFHFYGMNIDQLQAEVEVYKTYNKPIWVTEVSALQRMPGSVLKYRSRAASTVRTRRERGSCITAPTRSVIH